MRKSAVLMSLMIIALIGAACPAIADDAEQVVITKIGTISANYDENDAIVSLDLTVDETVYELEGGDRKALTAAIGERVTITGTLDEDGRTITVKTLVVNKPVAIDAEIDQADDMGADENM